MSKAADPWATAAAALPLAFAQVREDPRLDLEFARQLPEGARVMMIASGGETAVCMARLPLSSLELVDINPAQLALARCRMHLAETCSPGESMALLGHQPMSPEERGLYWTRLFESFGLAHDCLGPMSLIASCGLDHCGRYEAAFAELRRLLDPLEIERFLITHDAATASRMISADTALGAALDAAFGAALRLENLVALFGECATQNPRQPFHQHFLQQLRTFTAREAPASNPWVWQLLAGKFPPNCPADWLMEASRLQVRASYRCMSMGDALADTVAASVDFLHISNILDWLSPDEARAVLAAAKRALRPGGSLIIRQLNSTLDIPSLDSGLHWDEERGRRMQRMDRSFFYPDIHIAIRP